MILLTSRWSKKYRSRVKQTTGYILYTTGEGVRKLGKERFVNYDCTKFCNTIFSRRYHFVWRYLLTIILPVKRLNTRNLRMLYIRYVFSSNPKIVVFKYNLLFWPKTEYRTKYKKNLYLNSQSVSGRGRNSKILLIRCTGLKGLRNIVSRNT